MRKIPLIAVLLLILTRCGTAITIEEETDLHPVMIYEPAQPLPVQPEAEQTGPAQPAQDPRIPWAVRLFAAVDEMFDADGGQLWGFYLHAPIMFVDTSTQEVITNRSDPDGILVRQGEVYVGVLPEYPDFSRVPYAMFGGKLWIVICRSSSYAENTRFFRRAIAHKTIHWHQFSGTFGDVHGWSIDHMSEPEVRISKRLEINALMRAYRTTNEEYRLSFIHDALTIRAERRRVFDRGLDENRQEFMEGLAQYTEWSLTESTRSGILTRMEHWADDMVRDSTGRLFWYLSGALYAFLLTEMGAEWKPGITQDSDLGQLLKEAVGVTGLRDISEIDLMQYGYYEISREERRRAA